MIPSQRALSLAVVALMAFLVTALPSAVLGHVDPSTSTPMAFPNPVGKGQATTIQAVSGCVVNCSLTYAEAYIVPEMGAVFPGIGNHDQAGANGLAMMPVDFLWNSNTETVRVVNDTSWLNLGPHTVYVRTLGCGESPGSGTCWSEWVTFVLVVGSPAADTTAPQQVNPHFEPDNTITPGETQVDLEFTLDDTGDPGASPIAGAEYWANGCGLAGTGTPMSPRVGGFDSQVEDVFVTILNVDAFPDGTYTYYMHGWDSLGNGNVDPVACVSASLFVQNSPPETVAPKAHSGSVNPASVFVGGGPVTLNAFVEEGLTGSSTPIGAEYFVDPDPLGIPNPGPYPSGNGVAMAAADGVWDTANESVWAPSVGVSTWVAGTYTFYIHGRDFYGNWGDISIADEHTTAVLTIGTPPPPVPQSPAGIALMVSVANLVISWTPAGNPAGLDHYVLYRDAVPTVDGCPAGTATAISPIASTASSYTDAGRATDANRYFYTLRAANSLNQEDANCAMVGKIALDLPAGVSEISTPFLPPSAAPADIFFPIFPQFQGVGAFVGGAWTFYNFSMGGLLTAVTNGMGLRVHLSASARLPLVGRVPVAAVDRSLAVNGVGWYFIGAPHFASAGLAVPAAFDGNGLFGAWDRVLSYAGDPYDPWRQYHLTEAAFRDLTAIQGGRGYWIHIDSTGAFTWTPPLL